MAEKIIIFGQLNKKFLLPFLLALAQMILIIVNKYYPEEKKNLVFQQYEISLGEMSIIFLPYILKISSKEIPKEKEIKKKKCLHYFILCFLFFFDMLVKIDADTADYVLKDIDYSYSDSNLFLINGFTLLSIEMVVMICISKLLLKYKYFNHHLISIIIFVIIGISCDIILNNFDDIDTNFFIINSIRIVNTGVNALYFCYQKYMMEVHYYPYWNIAFIPGFFLFLFANVLLVWALVDPLKEKSRRSFIVSFYLYFQEVETGYIIGKIIIVLFLHIILCPLSILIVFYFSPAFILIIFQLSAIIDNLTQKPKESLYCIPLYICQFIALLIHLEILELNFCGLNKYTKKNINLRGINDLLDEGRDSVLETENIDINKDYAINVQPMKKYDEIEMRTSSYGRFPSINSLN